MQRVPTVTDIANGHTYVLGLSAAVLLGVAMLLAWRDQNRR